MITNFKGCVVDWYMKFSTQNAQKTLAKIKAGLTNKFKKLKSLSKCITDLKIYKAVIDRVNMRFRLDIQDFNG